MARVSEAEEATGTIAGVAERLASWARRAPKGLARVEYVSEVSRQRVVNRLRRLPDSEGIPFTEYAIPSGMSAQETVELLVKRLDAMPAGVVSLTGFAEFLVDRAEEARGFLYALNFNRERLAAPPLRQIWWMPSHVAAAFIQEIPDLNSWFLVRLALTEAVLVMKPDRAETELEPTPSPEPLDAVIEDAWELFDRFEKGIAQGESAEELIERFAMPAIQSLRHAGAESASRQMEGRLNAALRDAGTGSFTVAAARERALGKAIEKAESIYGPEAQQTVEAIRASGEWLYAQARHSEAEPLMRRVLTVNEERFGRSHPEVATDLNNLALLLQATNRLAEAEPLMRRALDIDEEAFGPDHPNVAIRLNNLASLLQATNRLAEAEPLMRRALDILEQSYGEKHPRTVVARENLDAMLRRSK